MLMGIVKANRIRKHMQHHPVVTYLRVLGFAIGAFLFVFMIYRSSQMAGNPTYVKGKPFLQQIAASNNDYLGLQSVSFGPVAVQSSSPHQTTTASESTSTNAAPHTEAPSARADSQAGSISHTAVPATATHPTEANPDSNTLHGRAIGMAKRNN